MDITLAQIIDAGYDLKATTVDAWRNYDEHDPQPGYFQFDWLSARHPDLYHKFALSTIGLMTELHKVVDLAGLEVLDCGAGTGRSTIEAARRAKRVTALDVFAPPLYLGREMVSQAGLSNVTHVRAHSASLPFQANSFDACICAWSILDHPEAYRVLRPGGYILELGSAPGALCGELTATLASIYPQLITEIAPADCYDAACPDSDTRIGDPTWNGLPVIPPSILHDFTYVADYVDPQEAAAIVGRLYGPTARRYILERQQATLSWRLRIAISRVRKEP